MQQRTLERPGSRAARPPLFPVWLAAIMMTSPACTPDPTPVTTGTATSDATLLDDDDVSSPPLVPCGIQGQRGYPCLQTVQLELANGLDAPETPLSLSLYLTASLGGSSMPSPSTTADAIELLEPPFTFPLKATPVVSEGDTYVAQAWVDADQSGGISSGDLLATSASFTAGPTALTLVLAAQ